MELTGQDVKDYPYIYAWGTYLGSRPHYIAYRIHQARGAEAPNTTYSTKDPHHKEWRTIDEVSERRRQDLNDIIAKRLAETA